MKVKLISQPINWPTGAIPAREADPPLDYCAERTAMVPTRRRTRAQNRAQRIATERRLTITGVAHLKPTTTCHRSDLEQPHAALGMSQCASLPWPEPTS
jgi:hypothetical protein